MKHNTIREFKLWTICMSAGMTILATEVAVKARRPAMGPTDFVPSIADVRSEPNHTATLEELPAALVTDLLVESVVQIESAGKSHLVGGKGERGLMQLREGTWRETTRRHFGRVIPFSRAFEPELNRQIGTAYLAYLHQFLQNHRGQWQADERALLLACYNAGPQRVASAGFRIGNLPASTRDYVQRASALHDFYLNEHALKLEPGEPGGALQIVQLQPEQNS